MNNLKISYKKLWHSLLDKDINRSDLRKLTGISTTTVQKLNRDESVGVDILLRICEKTGLKVEDIVEFAENVKEQTNDR